MKPNTALCFVLAGGALTLRERRGLLLSAAAVVCAVSALTLAEYLTGANLGMDQFLFHDSGDSHTVHLGRMAPMTAFCFLCASVALIALKARTYSLRLVGQIPALAIGVIGMVTLLGYAYGSSELYRLGYGTSMALHTGAAFMALGLGILFAHTDGLITDLASPGPGGHLARRLLPAAILVPAIAGWLHILGEDTDLFSAHLAAGLFVLAMILAFATVTWLTARTLDRADATRRQIETQLRNQAELMDQAHEALVVRTAEGEIQFWNSGAERLYGWSTTEALGQSLHVLLRTEGLSPDHEAQLERTGHFEGELIHTTRDGQRVNVESRKTAIQLDGGGILIMESNRDITARKQAEEALLQLNTELEQRIAAKTVELRQANEMLEQRVAERSAELRSANENLRASRLAALNLTDDAIAARRQAEQATVELRATNQEMASLAEQRGKALESLADSEQQLRLAQDAADIEIWDFDPRSGVMQCWSRVKAWWGLSPEQTYTYDVWQSRLHPDDKDAAVAAMLQSQEPDGTCRQDTEYRVVQSDDSTLWISVHSQTHFAELDDQLQAIRIVGTMQDITARKQQEQDLLKLNRTLKALSDNNQAIMLAKDELEYLNQVCQIIAMDCGYAMVWIAYKENDKEKNVRPVAHAGLDMGYLETLGIIWSDTDRGQGPTGTCIRTGKVSQCRNMLTDPKFAPWREQAIKRGYASSLVLPLFVQGDVLGAITIYSKQPDSFATSEVELLTDLATDLAFGITTLRLRMEKKLDEEKILSLARFPEENPDAVLRILLDGTMSYANPASRVLLDEFGFAGKGQAPETLRNPALESLTSGKTIRRDIACRDMVFALAFAPFPDTGYVNIYGRDVTARRAAELALNESERRYRSLFAGMSEGFALYEIICDAGGKPIDYRFLDVNPAFEKLTGLKKERVVGKRVLEVMPGTERIWVENYGRVALSGEPCHFDSYSADLDRWYEVYAYCPIRDQFATLFMDLTDIRRAQEREREALALAAAARTAVDTLESVGEGVLVIGLDGRILSVNPALEHMSGYRDSDLRGERLDELLPKLIAKDDQATALDTIRKSLQGEASGVKTLTMIGKGERVPILLGVSFIRNSEGNPTAVVATMRDISEIHDMQKRHREESQRYEEHLRSLAATLSSTEEQERRRMAGHIHDTIIQSLSLSRIRLGSVRQNLQEGGRLDEVKIIDGIRTLIDEGITQSRLTMSDLRPPLLYELGLGPAVEELAHKLSQQHQVHISVRYAELPQLTNEALSGLLFQSTRELIMNALKHSGAKNIEITIQQVGDLLRLQVQDHGAGFDISTLEGIHKSSEHGFGLFSIHERLHGYDGKLEISSTPGSGTTATIDVPLQPAPHDVAAD
jgi:PAS domain S-box-containing protein